jgi:hypothetical protein
MVEPENRGAWPHGLQACASHDFPRIRQEGCLCIDKTAHDYPTDDEQQVESFNTLHSHLAGLIQVMDRFLAWIAKF